MKVFVYYNLHKKCFSIRDEDTRLVKWHSKFVLLRNVQFKVSEKGRQRVLKEKRKNVHAGVVGELVEIDPKYLPNNFIKSRTVRYNPYKNKSFVYEENNQPIHSAKYALMHSACVSVVD